MGTKNQTTTLSTFVTFLRPNILQAGGAHKSRLGISKILANDKRYGENFQVHILPKR